jgi:hypothetical protein
LATTTSDVVHNEWAKLAATFWNNSAVAAFVGGVVTPIFSDKFRVLTKGGIFILGMLLATVARMSEAKSGISRPNGQKSTRMYALG